MDQGGQERLKDYSREKLTTLRGEELLPGLKLGADTITVNQVKINVTAAEPVPATERTAEDGTTGDGRKVNHRGNWSRMEDGIHESESPTRGESPRRRKQEKWNDGEGRMKREKREEGGEEGE